MNNLATQINTKQIELDMQLDRVVQLGRELAGAYRSGGPCGKRARVRRQHRSHAQDRRAIASKEKIVQDVETEMLKLGELESKYLFHLEMSNLFAMQLRTMLSQLSPEAMRQPGIRTLKQKVNFPLGENG